MDDGDSPQLITSENAAKFTMSIFQVMQPSFSRSVFIEQMLGYGFTDKWDLGLLEAKYFYGMSAHRIADEQHYVSHDTVSRRLKQLHTLLKERGYKRKSSK